MKPLAVFELALLHIYRMRFLYDLFLFLYPLGIRVAALKNEKARQWINGRNQWEETIRLEVAKGNGPIIWFHCASLGEFEQGRPVIESIKQRHPNYRVLLTFFSPSGYEARKNYSGADIVQYLPLDGKSNARSFLDSTQPVMAVFIKYETWYYYLNALHQRKIPTLLISAIFFKEQIYFRPWGGFMKKMLNCFTHIFAQDETSYALLRSSNVTSPFSLGGDTRYDRVVQITHEHVHIRTLELFCEQSDVIVAGSTWKEDEQYLHSLSQRHPSLKLIIAPHEIGQHHIQRLKEQFEQSITFSELEQSHDPSSYKTVIIDCIGLLSKLYRFSTLAYVGGGFNSSGIHNILEASAYGRVVLFGPQFSISNEAKALIALELAYSYAQQDELSTRVGQLLNDRTALNEKNSAAHQFVMENKGATNRILSYMEKFYFYTS